ncbi:MAG: hypothetical protein ABF251_03215 [Nonlabens sp.]|uniref:hypothetical protein n=1 Tax=Nonlabens sp. TaxID=1888209 RepID=UPI00321AB1EA
MTTILRISLLIIILSSLMGCKNSSEIDKTSSIESKIKKDTILSTTSQIKDTKAKPHSNNTFENALVYKYVDAPSGLNFRDVPKGKILGKLPDNLRIQILEVTDVTSDIEDSGKSISGNWVKIKAERAVGYVFDAFLKDEYREIEYKDTINELSIFSLSMYYDEENNYYPFVSLTDDFWNMRFPEVAKEYEENDYQETNKEYSYPVRDKERSKFLNNREIKETDYLFIYNFRKNQLKTFKVKNLLLFSHESIYGGSYLTGFDLKDLIDTSEISYENTFAHIGKENPFEIGKVKSIQWKLIDNKKVPKIELVYNSFYKSSNYIVELSYHDTQEENDY